jgi:hypothetical protein
MGSIPSRSLISDVLGWASSPEPTEPSLYKPKPSWALLRACNGLISEARACGSSLGFDILQSGMQIYNWKGKILFSFKNQINKMKIKSDTAKLVNISG